MKYETLYSEDVQYTGIAEVVSFAEEKNHTDKYIIKIKSLSIENQTVKKAKNTKLIIYVDKSFDFEYGDIIFFEGNFERAQDQRNDKGFDYERYLRQSKIYGIFDIENIELLKEGSGIVHSFFKFRNNLKEKLYEIYDDDKAGFLAGILLRR